MRRPHEPEEPISAEFYGEVAARLRAFRVQRKLTQSQLAAMVDTTEAEMIAWESGKTVIYLDEVIHLCEALQVSPHDLLGWKTKQ
jgi:transcriptional regulator with XRE-family HTH domain